jgi:signal transduction histidine kinase
MQTLGMVLLYLVTLSMIVFIFFNAQFGIGLEALLNSPFGDRVDTIADAISSNLQATERKNWSDVLKNFDKLYNVKFYVVDVHGNQLAGEPLNMPKALQDKVIEFPPGMPPQLIGMMQEPGHGFPPPGLMRVDPHEIPSPFSMHEHLHGFTPPDSKLSPQASLSPDRSYNFPRQFPPPEQTYTGPHQFPTADRMPTGPHQFPTADRMPTGPHQFPTADRMPTAPHQFSSHGRINTGPDQFQLPPGQENFASADFRDFPPPPSDVVGMQFSTGIKGSVGSARPHLVTLRGFHPHPFMHAQGRFIVHTASPDTFFIGTKVMLFDTERMRPEPSYVLASTNNFWQSTLLFDFRFLLLMAGITLLLSLLFWWPFVHQIARSIGELTKVTEKIADGNFDARILRARHDEIGRLGDAVNTMAEKLNQYVLSQKRFIADVSHELFSPLARLHMAVELLEGCKPEDSARHFKEINEEIDEMKSLVTELLAFSKAGLVKTERQLTRVDLKPIFDDLTAKFGDQIEMKVSLNPAPTVLGDAILLSRSFSNIIRNSIRYAGGAGPLSIQTKHEGAEIVVSFSDCGPGVPEDTLKYLGEPFFRPEFSRNRNSGGFGLGLAIVKSCIGACNGSVTLSNLDNGGLNVDIRLKSVA